MIQDAETIVTNVEAALPDCKSILESENFSKDSSPLLIAMGKNAFGDIFIVDLASMPHMLVAGATGAGKSVFLNSLLVSLITKNNPKNLKNDPNNLKNDPENLKNIPIYNREMASSTYLSYQRALLNSRFIDIKN